MWLLVLDIHFWINEGEPFKHLRFNGCYDGWVHRGETTDLLGEFRVKVAGRFLSFLQEKVKICMRIPSFSANPSFLFLPPSTPHLPPFLPLPPSSFSLHPPTHPPTLPPSLPHYFWLVRWFHFSPLQLLPVNAFEAEEVGHASSEVFVKSALLHSRSSSQQ